MKKLSEEIEDRAKVQRRSDYDHQTRCTEFLAEVERAETGVYVSGDSRDSTNYVGLRAAIRDVLRAGECYFYRFTCDHCGTQLINYRPNEVLMSNPPQRHVGCPGCGFVASIT